MNTRRHRTASAPDLRPNFTRRWGQEHLRVMVFTLGQLYRNWLATALTAAVIGITLALPMGINVLLDNFNRLSLGWQSTTQASIYLKFSVSEAAGKQLAEQLASQEGIETTRYISRAQSLAEFRAHSGLGSALDLLNENPLPAVILLQPDADLPAKQVQALIDKLRSNPAVETAQLDQRWLQRLRAIVHIIRVIIQTIAILLAIAVIIVVGNTIRLDIQNRKDEIIVMKLIGAPDSFIRRPFLYTGFWYGALGGLLALILLGILQWNLGGAVTDLAGLYDSNFRLAGLGFGDALTLLAASIALGLLGSAWTVGRHLSAIEPR